MIHRPTGGLIAAPGGAMNWDYRYCWLRDSTFTLGALINAGYHDEAQNWRDWLLRAMAEKARRHARLREIGARRQLQYGLMLALALATTPALAQTGSGLADPAARPAPRSIGTWSD
jgi:hypothetical protein